MSLSGRSRGHRHQPVALAAAPRAVQEARIREFVYLDEVSVQSLLASLVGELPTEVTTLSARSAEAELSARVGSAVPLTPTVEFASRFKGASSTSSQTLSRAVSESLFKRLYEHIQHRLVWSTGTSRSDAPLRLVRGDLIEVEVILAPDPIYGFNSAMGVMSGIADDYPILAKQGATAAILEEARPIQAVLERLLAGLIPLKSRAVELSATRIDGDLVLKPATIAHQPSNSDIAVSVVGVTEQDKYWRDVRRVLFSGDRFTVLGRIARDGLQSDWTPVKVMEVMRDVAPAFFDAMANASKVGFAEPINLPLERNRDAMEAALAEYARMVVDDRLSGEQNAAISSFATSRREAADSVTSQRAAFDELGIYLVDLGLVSKMPPDARSLRAQARKKAGLHGSSEVKGLNDFQTTATAEAKEPEALMDLEVIAIYW